MNCDYCIVATTLQTAGDCHVDSSLFHCYSFSVFPFNSVGNYACIKNKVFFSLTPRALQILPCIVPFNLLYKHTGCQMKWINLFITWPVSVPNQSEKQRCSSQKQVMHFFYYFFFWRVIVSSLNCLEEVLLIGIVLFSHFSEQRI